MITNDGHAVSFFLLTFHKPIYTLLKNVIEIVKTAVTPCLLELSRVNSSRPPCKPTYFAFRFLPKIENDWFDFQEFFYALSEFSEFFPYYVKLERGSFSHFEKELLVVK